ncbi:MFS transporter [Gulosibacter molinativorax]|uniref:MFS transporter n=1 Tax=Gulosibacter molinativorax TaxID=256821 RepID=A0ABT7CA18_9MICO|nr:MFS transporter [Gulosibacter molinativorax]MDJ1372002.1 MFS transporter [Gulosibacter molinativorax]
MSVPAPEAPRRAPVILLIVLMIAMAAGPVFNFALSALSSTVLIEFNITESQYGLLLTLIFVSAGITSAFVGRVADRLDPRAQIVLIIGGVIVALLVSASLTSYWVLVVAALIAGPAQSFSNPLTNRIIGARVPLQQRSSWMGWKQSGVQMGMLISGLIFPVIAAAAGWRGAALAGAAVLVPALILSWIVISKLRLPKPDQTQPITASIQLPGKSKRMPAAVWLFAVASFLNAVGTQGVNGFASLFAVNAMGYSITIAGLMLGVIGVFGILSRIGWGRITGKLGKPAPLIMVMSLGGIAGLAFLIAAEYTQVDAFMWIGVILHAILPLAANVVINSGIVEAAPKGRIGVASGLVAAGMYLGFALGPAILGTIVETTGAFTMGWVAVAVTYLGCFIVAVILLRVQRQESR